VLVLVILGLIWGFVLIPPYLQTRRESRPGDSIASFRQQLHVLERTTPGERRSDPARLDGGRNEVARHDPRSNVAQLAPRRPRPQVVASHAAVRRAEARRRRRDVFVVLLALAGGTLVLALAAGSPFWMVHLVVDVVLVAYVALLVSIQRQQLERAHKVRPMSRPAPRRREPAADLALRRYGS